MLSFDDYKNKYKSVNTIGQYLKEMSDEVVQETFDNDIGTRQCYLYDFYHDDQPDLECGYDPSKSLTKIPVKLKFIVKSYKTMAKDDPEYHIMFEPDVWNSMSCMPQWFVNDYQRLGIQFPIGLYVDIPDDRGVYQKWIVMYKETANQFPKFGVLKCNYKFKWITNDGIYRHKRFMWGIEVTQNSYTSGIYTDYLITRFEEQGKFYLPWNTISSELRHDKRLFISMLQEEPFVYKITKIKNTSPKGIIAFTVKQDRYEPEHDYVVLDVFDKNYGEMYADYYESSVLPKPEEIKQAYYMKITAHNYHVKLNSTKILTACIYDSNDVDVTNVFKNELITWDVKLKDPSSESVIEIDHDYRKKEGNEFKYKFKFTGDEKYINKNLIATCNIKDIAAFVELDICAL